MFLYIQIIARIQTFGKVVINEEHKESLDC